uniref:Wadjet protein JetD C-terminal domain-containing protein n=1 Tax=Batrachochytrium dendrobatidis (strain JAM81 / FGSC 10211) TaxID=684364 RepID=F4PF73_BATDJ|eukprot:XP_006683257.1 hypothetical protein BATDEDRAFT_93023 [Batrachochytrium dendrobatidis JAM81]
MIFHNVLLPGNIEAEKFLSSSHGGTLMKRLKLSPNDLRFKVVPEPPSYWENPYSSDPNEVLIVEGLATYNTLRECLSYKREWEFGPIPRFLVWGEGYHIETTIDYLAELTDDIQSLAIRYLGDMDYEGYNIFANVKRKKPYLNISLGHSFYSFLSSYSNYATPVWTHQRVVQDTLELLKEQCKDHPETYQVIEGLWKENKRIAQEIISLETMFQKGEG